MTPITLPLITVDSFLPKSDTQTTSVHTILIRQMMISYDVLNKVREGPSVFHSQLNISDLVQKVYKVNTAFP